MIVEAAVALFTLYYQCGLEELQGNHKALGETGVRDAGYRVTCYGHCGGSTLLAHYVPRSALLAGCGSGMEASVWRVEDNHLLILAH